MRGVVASARVEVRHVECQLAAWAAVEAKVGAVTATVRTAVSKSRHRTQSAQ